MVGMEIEKAGIPGLWVWKASGAAVKHFIPYKRYCKLHFSNSLWGYLENRAKKYEKEAGQSFRGNIVVPDDLEVVEISG